MKEAYAAFGGNSGIPSSRLHFFPNLESRGGAAIASNSRGVARTLWRFPAAFPLICEGSWGRGRWRWRGALSVSECGPNEEVSD